MVTHSLIYSIPVRHRPFSMALCQSTLRRHALPCNKNVVPDVASRSEKPQSLTFISTRVVFLNKTLWLDRIATRNRPGEFITQRCAAKIFVVRSNLVGLPSTSHLSTAEKIGDNWTLVFQMVAIFNQSNDLRKIATCNSVQTRERKCQRQALQC